MVLIFTVDFFKNFHSVQNFIMDFIFSLKYLQVVVYFASVTYMIVFYEPKVLPS